MLGISRPCASSHLAALRMQERDHDGRGVRAELEAALVLCPVLDGPVLDIARALLRDSDRLSAVELSAIARCSEREAEAVLAALRAP